MNKKNILLLLLIAFYMAACTDIVDKIDDTVLPDTETTQLLVLAEGSMNANNSTLAFYNLETSQKNLNYFMSVNSRGLGDTGNDMIKHGSKVYVVMSGSSIIEVTNANNGKSVKQIPMKTTDGSAKTPRFIVAYGSKVYVTSFDDTVTRIDTASLTIDGSITVGRDPEGIAIKNNKIYVANSGGLDFATGNYDNTVSVIDLQSFKEEKKIEVGMNPYKVYTDSQSDIYVSVRGNYVSELSSFKKINTSNGTVTTIDNISASEFIIVDNKAYFLEIDWGKPSVVKVYDCLNEKMITESFITDGTVIEDGYKINVDGVSGDVYINTSDYISAGDVFCYDKNGKFKFKLEDVGNNPGAIVFLE